MADDTAKHDLEEHDDGRHADEAREDVEALFTGATQLTFFEEDAVVYQLSVAAVLPGDAVC